MESKINMTSITGIVVVDIDVAVAGVATFTNKHATNSPNLRAESVCGMVM